MPVADCKTEPFYVPTIDIAPFLKDPNGPGCDRIILEVRRACLSTGFFQITGHGVPKSLQQSLFDSAAKLFALPFEEKRKLDATKTVGLRGYDVLASQSYEGDVLPDLKERVKDRRFFMGSNVWPPESLLSSKDLKKPAEAYHTVLLKLAIVVLDMIARSLPYGNNVSDKIVSNNPVAPLRMLHYPKARKTEQRQLGASAHTDFGAITLLLQDPNPGLEVLDPQKGEWVPVMPNTNAYVVNIGDMLTKMTRGEYKSSWHRVLNKNSGDRCSIVFFFKGNVDYPLSPLDGMPVDGRTLTVEEHMIKRMTESYAMGEKSDGPAKVRGTDGVGRREGDTCIASTRARGHPAFTRESKAREIAQYQM